MKHVPVKEAQRSLASVIEDAQEGPVILEKRGTPRAAVISIAHLRHYQRLWAMFVDEGEAFALHAALSDIESGRPRSGERNLALARRLAAFREPASSGAGEGGLTPGARPR